MNDNLPQFKKAIIWWAKRGVYCEFFKHSRKFIRINYLGKKPKIKDYEQSIST